NVLIKGTSLGTVTDAMGGYRIDVPASDAVLVFSFVGFVSQEVPVADRTKIDITLEEDVTNLEEVVVVGYGEQRRVTLTGSVAAITSDDIVTTKTENVQNALTGKVPGARVVQKTSEPGVFTNDFDIRGFGAPLIVIDGVPRDNITRLNANDIESI